MALKTVTDACEFESHLSLHEGSKLYFFTADEHYNHAKIIVYCDRPFNSVEDMNTEMIKRHNEMVKDDDITIHAGDFALCSKKEAYKIINQLNGKHIFLKGSHDRWINRNSHTVFNLTIEGQPITICHYAMRVWHRSHYNSWQLYGHSHGNLESEGKQLDIGVDTNNFYPYSFTQIQSIMEDKPDNFNLIRK